VKKEFKKDIFVTVPMIMDMELAVSKTAEALATMSEFQPDQVDEIKHAVIEACINAIEHSHSKDNRIYLRFRQYSDRLEIRVRDNGKGFKISEVEKPDLKKKMATGARKRGWGLTLIKNLMDEVKIETKDTGTSITMIKEVLPKQSRKHAHDGF